MPSETGIVESFLMVPIGLFMFEMLLLPNFMAWMGLTDALVQFFFMVAAFALVCFGVAGIVMNDFRKEKE